MTDKELLELAAKASGMEEDRRYPGCYYSDNGTAWNPLTDDGDALRLAVKLAIQIEPWVHGDDASARALVKEVLIESPHNGDPYAATRMAIVRAAAEIGEGMK